MKSLFWSGIAAGLALGGITQVIAGATEYFVLSLAGELSRTRSLFGGIPPALLGNIVEGNGLFALISYGQVQAEIDGGRDRITITIRTHRSAS